MIWSEIAALADIMTSTGRRLRSVGFRALQSHWHWPDDDATVLAIGQTLAAHGWTLRDDRHLQIAPPEGGNAYRKLSSDPAYTPPEAALLAERLQAPLQATTITDWLWLIVPEIAKHWVISADFSEDDALQEGFLGLLAAWHAPSTRPDQPAQQWVKRARSDIRRNIHRAYMKASHTIRLPRHIQALLVEIDTAHWAIAAALGHEPTVREIADYLFRPIPQIHDALRYRHDPTSLDTSAFYGDDDAVSRQDLIADPQSLDPLDAVAEATTPIDPALIPYLRILQARDWTIDQIAQLTDWAPDAITQACGRIDTPADPCSLSTSA